MHTCMHAIAFCPLARASRETTRASSAKDSPRCYSLRMPLLAVGTTNPGKVAAVRDALASYPALSGMYLLCALTSFTAPVVSVLPRSWRMSLSPSCSFANAAFHGSGTGWTPSPQKVSSGVSDQPKTLAETTQGARNRAERAAAAAGADAFGIGMESGLFESEGRLFDVCACAIFDGKEMHIGYSCAWELPPAVQEKVVKEGMDLTQVSQSDYRTAAAAAARSAIVDQQSRRVSLTWLDARNRRRLSMPAKSATIRTSETRAA